MTTKKQGTGMTMLQQIINAGKFLGLGRRQKRKMKQACKECPTEHLRVTYVNGTQIRYVPKKVEGQLLVCDAYVSTKELPQEVLEQNVAISRFEFPKGSMQGLFDRYHAALMGHECLRWEDGTEVTHQELHGEQIEVGSVAPPQQTRFDKPAGGMGRTN